MSYPINKPAGPAQPLKHVIEQYKHRAQTVTCVCGWHGSTIPTAQGPSEWSGHVAANRVKRS
ncbi:MAG: hypothetical protein H0V12_03350 [Chloroflexi bacterium]|nr:hypothetical protein [Chloroflexota bacterium]